MFKKLPSIDDRSLNSTCKGYSKYMKNSSPLPNIKQALDNWARLPAYEPKATFRATLPDESIYFGAAVIKRKGKHFLYHGEITRLFNKEF